MLILQLQADLGISHSYNTNAYYSSHSDCSVAQPKVNFKILY